MAQKNHGAAEFGGNEGNFGETRFARKCAEVAGVISERTSVPFKILIPICTLLVLCTWRISGSINRIQTDLDKSWKIRHQEVFVRQLQRGNTNLFVPDAREIFETQPTNSKIIE